MSRWVQREHPKIELPERAIGIGADVLLRSVSDYQRRQRDPGPPRTHELPELLSLPAPSIRDDTVMIAACALLQRPYPTSRCPGEPMPTLDEARRAIDSARFVSGVVEGMDLTP